MNKVLIFLKQRTKVISIVISILIVMFLIYKNILSLLVGISLAIAYALYIILKKSTPRKRKIIYMTTAGALLILFIIHTALLVVATKKYEKSLIKIRDIAMPVTLEEIIINDPNRKLLPEENAVELLKPYRDIGWWSDGAWPETPQKYIENENFGTSAEIGVFDNLKKGDYDLHKPNFDSNTIYKLKSYISKLVNNKEELKVFDKFINSDYSDHYIFTDKEISLLKSYLPRHAYNKEAHMENNKYQAYLTVRNSSLEKMNEKEITLLKSYISKRKGTIELIKKMAKCKGFFIEINKADPISTLIPDLLKVRETFEIFCLDIELKEKANKIDEAISDLKKYYYVNEIMNFRKTGTLLSSMMGFGVTNISLSVISKMKENENITEKQCEELIELLEESEKKGVKAYTCSLNNTRALNEIYFDETFRKNRETIGYIFFASNGYSSRSDLLTRLIGEAYYSYLFKPLRIMGKSMHCEFMFSEIKSSQEEYFVDSNTYVNIPWYDVISKWVIRDLETTKKQVFIERNKLVMLKTELLIQDFRLKTGKLPASLQGIKKVTGYDVPKDVMTGKEFKYELNGNQYTLKSEYKEKKEKRKNNESTVVSVTN